MRLAVVELLVIVLVVVILFGTKKIPELGRSLGQAIKEVKDSLKGKKHTKD